MTIKLKENVPLWKQYKKLKKIFTKLEKKFENTNEKAVVLRNRLLKKSKNIQDKIDFIESIKV